MIPAVRYRRVGDRYERKDGTFRVWNGTRLQKACGLCDKRPNFNRPGEKRGLYCGDHKLSGMVNVVSRTCVHCDKRPYFNRPGEKRGVYCGDHKLSGMVNVVSRTCVHCDKRPNFNRPDEKRGLYCGDHKLPGMVNVVSRTCVHCDKRPHFTRPGEKRGVYCAAHKLPGMIDVVNRTCVHCDKQPYFNRPGEKRGLYCADHKLTGMVDVKNPTCVHCNKQPYFNRPSEKRGLYCGDHKLPGMVNVVSRTCVHCNKQPYFNRPGEMRGLYCADHKLPGMVDVKNPTCKAGYCGGALANRAYDGYCARCFKHLFPHDPRTLAARVKSKELRVRDRINQELDGFVHDKPLYTGHCDCTHRRRIDHRRIVNGVLIAVETDEHQHRRYDPNDEVHRYHDVFMAYSHHTVWLRFNPDAYRDAAGHRRNPDLDDRLVVLIDEIRRHMARARRGEVTELCEVVPLFYDGSGPDGLQTA